MRRPMLTTLAALSMMVTVTPIAAAQTVPDRAVEKTRVIVELDPAGPASRAFSNDIVSRFGGRRSFVFEHAVSGFVAELPNAAIQALQRNPNVVRITPDRVVVQLEAQDVPTGWDRIEADLAPPAPTGGACPAGETCTDVDIAILDTGVNAHPDLNVVERTDCSGIIFPGLGSCIDGSGLDGNSHGTHVAGTAAAFDNDIGVVGIAPGARIHSVKVLGDGGTGFLGGILAGIDWVTGRADVIDVVNMSLSGEFADPTFDTALANSVAAGVVYAVAAGNSGQDASLESPANHPDVITTSAVADADGAAGGLAGFTCRDGETDDTLATFSNFGSVVDIAAPGVCILSTGNDGGYSVKSGTSMASPHVAGAAARYVAIHGRDLDDSGTVDKSDVDAVKAALIGDAHPQGTACGFIGDPDIYPEPMLFVNGPAFGGNAVCDQAPVDETPPLPPGSLTATADGYPINIEWTAGSDPDSGIRGHRLYRNTVPSTGETLIATTGPSVESYTDTDTTPGTTYSYEITAVNYQFGESTRTGPAQATTSTDDPTDAGWWAYEDQTGTSASDSTAWRRSATLQNGTGWDAGKIAGGVVLDGSDDRIDLDPNILDGAGDISFATWFRTTKTGTQTMISGANAGNENEYTITFVDDTTLRFYSGANPNAGATWQLPDSIADGEWHHLVVRRINDPSHVWAYIDGVSVGGFLITIPMEPVDIEGLVLGQDQDGVLSGFQSAEAFDGDLDETRLFTRVLTLEEIDALSGRDLTAPSAPASLSAAAAGHGIDLTWAPATDPESGIATYRISRDDGAGGPIERLTEVPGTATSYRDTAVAGSTTYTYHVTAINGGDLEGPPSPTDSATTPAADATLQGWWPLDDGAGTTATDASPAARHGTLVNGPTWTAEGEIAGALTFDGNDDRIDLDHAVLNGAADVTVAMWVRTTDTGIQALISGATELNDAEYEWFLLSNPDLRLRFYTGESITSYVWWPTPTVADGEWHHLAVTRDDANDIAELFIDGLSQGTRGAVLEQLQIDAGGLVLGQDQDTVGGSFDPTQAFAGSLDEIRIFNRLLSANEIGVLAGLPPAPSTNASPTLDPIGPQSGDELSPLSFTATASDPDTGQTLTFSLSGAEPAGAVIDPVSGVFSWTPSEADGPGEFTFDVIVTDDGTPALSDSETITVTVGELDTAPVLDAVGDKSATEGVELSFVVTASDVDLPAQVLTFGLGAGAPAGASIDPVTGVFTWTPSEAQSPGSFSFDVVVTDDTLLSDAETITIDVTDTNSPPVLTSIGPQSGDEGTVISFTASASDSDTPAQTLTFSLSGTVPAGASIDPVSGVFTWTPSEADGPGEYTFDVIVTDDGTPNLADSETITVTVDEVDTAPVLDAVGDKSATEGMELSFVVTASDVDLPAQVLTFGLGAGAPAGASIDPVTGVFTWTPSEAQSPGSYSFDVVVTDDTLLSDAETITIDVTDTNTAPVLASIGDRSGDELIEISFTASASDVDEPQQSLSFSLSGHPAGAVIDPLTGVFTWTPSEADGPGEYTFDVVVTDDGTPALSDSETITVTVGEVNTAPILATIGDQSVEEGAELTFTASASDGDLPLQALTYSLQGDVPAGASIDPNTGAFLWVPDETQGPGSYTFDVVVTDDGTPSFSANETVNVTVTEANSPPVADAGGDQLGIVVGQSVALDGSGSTDSDIPTQPLAYAWSFESLPGGSAATLQNPNSINASFVPDVAGTYVVRLQVGDGDSTGTDTVTVTVVDAVTVTQHAIAEATIYGLVTAGDLSSTHVADGVSETLEEERTDGHPRTRTSRLEHIWTFDVQPGDAVDLTVTATRPDNADSEDFTFAYSTDGGSTFVPFVTISASVTTGSAPLAANTSGEVLVRVTDTDRSARAVGRDTVDVDAIVITTTNPGPQLPEVAVTATDAFADEAGEPGTFTFTRDISDGPLSVGYEIGGTAVGGADYESISGTADFPAGVVEVTVDIVPIDDAADEGDESVSVSLQPGPGYHSGPASTAIVTIIDDDSSGGGEEYRASSEQPTYGSVTGDYTSTFAADGDVESITEEHYNGQNRTRLEHTWTIAGVTGSSATLTIDALSTDEPFVFEVSLDGGASWTPASTGSFPLNGATTVLVRVVDTNRSKGDTNLDTIHVDQILLTAT